MGALPMLVLWRELDGFLCFEFAELLPRLELDPLEAPEPPRGVVIPCLAMVGQVRQQGYAEWN
jgi:hypothetical protein